MNSIWKQMKQCWLCCKKNLISQNYDANVIKIKLKTKQNITVKSEQNQIKLELKKIALIIRIFVRSEPTTMNLSKHTKHTKRVKTEPLGYSAFDDSIVLLVISKIQKCLHEIAKTKFQHMQQTIRQINKDMHVISVQCKQKVKLCTLMSHITVFELIHNKKYNQALQIIHKQQNHLTHGTHIILRLLSYLLQGLVLKYLERQEQSKTIIVQALKQLDLSQLKIRSKSSDEGVIECTILCISIIAEHFGKFQSQPFGFKQIYTEAYRIAHKYLTQYHKLTQTLFSIFNKFHNQNNESMRKTKKKYLASIKKRASVNLGSNNTFLKDSQSDRSYLNFTLQPKSIDSRNQSGDFGMNTRSSIPKRLKTIEPHDLRQQKELCLSKLYGTRPKQNPALNQHHFKRPKLSSSLKASSYDPHYAVEMKELQSISKIYLPKLEAKRKDSQNRKKQKLNAIQVFKYGSTLSKLKPNYFDRIKTQQNSILEREGTQQTNCETNIPRKDTIGKDHESYNRQIDQTIENIARDKYQKEKLIIPLNQTNQQKNDNCQLI